MNILPFSDRLSDFDPTYKGLKRSNLASSCSLNLYFDPTYKGLKHELNHYSPSTFSMISILPIRDWNFPKKNGGGGLRKNFDPTYKGLKLKEEV